MARIKMFSNIDLKDAVVRRKLFCSESAAKESTRLMMCGDCGFKLESKSTTTNIACPKCGGTRFEVVRQFYSPKNTPEPVRTEEEQKEKENKNKNKVRVGLFSTLENEEEAFQKSFSETEDELELKLKEYSGQTLTLSECEKIFGEGSKSMLLEKGFAEIEDENTINILNTAFFFSRIFLKIIVQVTKTFELEPEVIKMPLEEKPEIIESLEDKIGPKGVIMIKKAHGFPIVNEENSWAKDSGIVNDLPLEFGGEKKPLPEFKEIIDERYPDAPEHILDILKNKGVVKVDGDLVEIQK